MKESKEVLAYIKALPEPKRSTLEALRKTILEILPESEECISYGMPAYKVNGKVLAGYAAFKNHLAYLPHSGQVFPVLAEELEKYVYTNGSLHFAIDKPLSKTLLKKLISVRKAHLGM